MRAVVFDRCGEPSDVLQLRDIPVPEPGPGQVRVRMLLCPVNPSDLMGVRGTHGGALPKLPGIAGREGVGIVEAAGAGMLGKFLVGKRVSVINHETGNWCDRTVVGARQAIPLAKDLPLEQCAMFFVNPATAYVMTQDTLRVGRGEWLLQTAAGSAVGKMVIRLGRHFGFRTINLVRRADQAAELSRLGADEVIPFDPPNSRPEDLREAVQRITGADGVRHIIDPVGGPTGSALIPCLGLNGRMLCYGTLSPDPLVFSGRLLMTRRASVEGFWLSRHMARLGLLGKLKLVRSITRLMRAGVLVSEVGKTFPLEEFADAIRTAEQPGRGGKTLIRIAE